MYRTIKISIVSIGLIAVMGCKQGQKEDHLAIKDPTHPIEIPVGVVMTEEQQTALSPDDVIKSLMEGNTRFRNDDLTARDYSKQVTNSAAGQYPDAVILSCLDSRIPVENVFDRGIGDLFVARVAGNFANEDILGSMEFACRISGSKLILVLGHNNCGAIKGAIDDVKLGNITPMLQKIKPAIAMVDYSGEKKSSNTEYMALACKSNVQYTIDNIRKNSPILNTMEKNGEIKIVGAVYNLENGKVDWMN
ncbi:MAG TPA: carbonic anhydrase family protein [Aequorivita sp.]|nr:carbonic anhydrase family protein [Aequorivita sp.]